LVGQQLSILKESTRGKKFSALSKRWRLSGECRRREEPIKFMTHATLGQQREAATTIYLANLSNQETKK